MKKLLGVLILLFLITTIFYFYKSYNKKFFTNIPDESPMSDIREEVKSQTITLISTGDIGLVRDINNEIQKRHDPNYPFLKIADYLKNADITITNLEGPLIKNCPIILTGFTFCGEGTNVKGLVYAGIDATSLANNHSTNFGLNGLSQTSIVLKSANITPFGQYDNIEYLNVKGKKIALVGFVELGNNWAGLNNATPANVAKLVSEAKKNADIVICAFHWGAEYTRKPTQNQVTLAHIAIDSGADIVLGNHPHWIQENEIYKGKFITYAQGNTIFDQDWSQETKEGVIYRFEYKNNKFKKIDEKYTIIENNSQPRFATEKESLDIKQKVINGIN